MIHAAVLVFALACYLYGGTLYRRAVYDAWSINNVDHRLFGGGVLVGIGLGLAGAALLLP